MNTAEPGRGGSMSAPTDGHAAGRGAGLVREARLARAFVRLTDPLVKDFDIVEFLHGWLWTRPRSWGPRAAGVRWPTSAAGCGWLLPHKSACGT